MSQPTLDPVASPGGVLVTKPKSTIYTVMLVIALIALLMACLFLYLEIREYGGLGNVKGPAASVWTDITGRFGSFA